MQLHAILSSFTTAPEWHLGIPRVAMCADLTDRLLQSLTHGEAPSGAEQHLPPGSPGLKVAKYVDDQYNRKAMEDLIDALLALRRELRNAVRPVRQADGISLDQYVLLKHLARDGPSSVGDLARHMGIASSSATATLKRLERAGFIVRVRSAEDQRMVQAHLTQTGTAIVARWRRRRREATARLLAGLDPHDQAELLRLIRLVLGREG